jgi:hypothetical protein
MAFFMNEPDITPLRLSAIDVASLTEVERVAVLVLLAGSEDPVVAEAVVDATRRVLERTRTRERRGPTGMGPS